MKFSTRHDIDAPIEYVFGRISDFDALERQAMRRGVGVTRTEPVTGSGIGAGWELEVPFRGKVRNVHATITTLDAPTDLKAKATSDGMDMDLEVELVALSRTRTRMVLRYDVRPKTLSARIVIRSVKFAKGTMDRRFERRVATYCDTMSDDYAKVREA